MKFTLEHKESISESFGLAQDSSDKLCDIISAKFKKYLLDDSDRKSKTELFTTIINSKEVQALGIDTTNIKHMTFAGWIYGYITVQIESSMEKAMKLIDLVSEMKTSSSEIDLKAEQNSSGNTEEKVVH